MPNAAVPQGRMYGASPLVVVVVLFRVLLLVLYLSNIEREALRALAACRPEDVRGLMVRSPADSKQ